MKTKFSFVRESPLYRIKGLLAKNGKTIKKKIACVKIKELVNSLKETPSITQEGLLEFWEKYGKFEFPKSCAIRELDIIPDYNFIFYRWESCYYQSSLFSIISNYVNIFCDDDWEKENIDLSTGDLYIFSDSILPISIKTKDSVKHFLFGIICNIHRRFYSHVIYDDVDYEYNDTSFVITNIEDILLWLEIAFLRLVPYSSYSPFGNQKLKEVIHPLNLAKLEDKVREEGLNHFLDVIQNKKPQFTII